MYRALVPSSVLSVTSMALAPALFENANTSSTSNTSKGGAVVEW